MFRRSLAGGNRHRRAGVRCAAGGGDAGLDIERVETAGLLQRVQALIAHPRQKRRVGIEQPVEPIDQHARGDQIEQRPVAPGFAARGWLGLRQPFGLRGGGFGGFRCGGLLDQGLGCVGCRRRLGIGAVFAVEPRRQLPREFVEGAVFHRRQHRRFRFADRAKRQHVLQRFLVGFAGGFHGRFQIGLW